MLTHGPGKSAVELAANTRAARVVRPEKEDDMSAAANVTAIAAVILNFISLLNLLPHRNGEWLGSVVGFGEGLNRGARRPVA
jgi:hypothetical protein